uniref:Uncharacterized protein n=1 Tax=Candidatus Kentrum sp. LPFa TaxID=2126335 RepID=A0A450W751_9GAMM|nr:MAG: hypothetical protein BECKLPF1236B_GA0070989_104113 [Candidatus Kentron sp. LPFa]
MIDENHQLNPLLAAIPLALADLRRGPGAFLVGVAAVAAVLAPVLILFGLKYGIVTAMTDRLTNDPYVRAIHPLGQARYDPAWLQRLAAREEVAFLAPLTRYLSAEARIEATRVIAQTIAWKICRHRLVSS